MIEIERLTSQSDQIWDDFVNRYIKKEYTFTLEWRDILRDVFNYQDYYYLIRNNGELIGVFPTFFINSRLLRKRFISIPFSDFGGFYFNSALEESIKLEIFSKIEEGLGNDVGISSIRDIPFEIRGPVPDSNEFLVNSGLFAKFNPYVRISIPMDTPWEAIESSFSRNLRRNFRQSVGKLKVSICENRDILGEIYRVYLANMKKFGSPPLPLSFFEKIWDKMKSKGRFLIFTASYNDAIIGALSLITYKDVIYSDLIMSDPKYDFTYPKVNLYLESLRFAWDSKKYRIYDFSRTRKSSGVFVHKLKWGGSVEDILYYYNKSAGNRYFFDQSQSNFKLISNIMKRLPLGAFQVTGKYLRKELGK